MRRTAILLGVAASIALAMLVLTIPTALILRCGFGNDCTSESKGAAGPGTGVVKSAAVEVPMSRTRSFLALLREDAAAQQMERLQSQYRVINVLRPRILVLDVDDDAAGRLRRDPAIAGVFEREVPADVIAQLQSDARLFVNAWAQQQAMGDKKRRGEGASWDTPGFEPPDIPRKTKKQ